VRVPAAVTCRVLGISRQAYYQWCAAPFSQRDYDDAHLINAALEIHADDPADEYRFIADELARRGYAASENRVWWICSMQQIFSLHAKKKGRSR
jgi:putative transposase